MTTAKMVHTPEGIPILEPNISFDGDGFYVSYNDYDTHIYGDVTTALVFGQMQHFYILNGDHTKQYLELIPKGFNACLEYFISNLFLKNKYSEMPKEI